ncbi:MAG TPA: LysR family transcriptional regulator [Methylocella sp.]|jgi:DNA-binding transcriptional LysR family regulator|nr:LysR family transcriptional regulator [Methylocella sp.]
MEIYQIIHFIAIVETGSFTKGADRAAVSQSAISASIAKLEAEFNVQLLDRRSPVVPTDAGARLFEVGKAILQICSALKGELETIARPTLLRIGILQSLSSGHVSKLLGSFRRVSSHVAIEVCDGSSEQLVELLASRQLDAVLTILDDRAAKFASRVLFKEPYVLAVPEDHRFAQQESVTLADLHDEPFIVRTGRDRFQDASNALVSRGFKIRVVYKTAQIDRTLALVAAGMGLSLIPAGLGTPGVKMVQVADLDFFRTYGLLWSREREDDLKEFIKFAESHRWTP